MQRSAGDKSRLFKGDRESHLHASEEEAIAFASKAAFAVIHTAKGVIAERDDLPDVWYELRPTNEWQDSTTFYYWQRVWSGRP